ncbi:hypothetical protein ACH42_13825 [Endozoicomonas sp. (ex Bugula neritina AB1)]|nr:hypothetical protein ACH42_13825 [Endozoicomonas sp. (ex Bugula neritina AB1)]
MEAVIKAKPKSSRWQAWLIFLIPTIAMSAAWFVYFTGVGIPDGRTNKGELILPSALLSELQLNDGSSLVEQQQLEGRWGVLVFGSVSCEQQGCQDSLYKTRQVHIALGKESDRLMRLYVAPETPVISERIRQEHPEMLWLHTSKALSLKALNVEKWPENQFYIVDPLGNIMMKYKPGQVGGDLLKDLKKLMKASKVG